MIDLQMDAAVSDSTITQKQAELNSLYDSFSEKYGLINDRANRLAYADDSSYYLLCAQMCIRDRRKTYLKEHRPILYNQMLLSEKLYRCV